MTTRIFSNPRQPLMLKDGVTPNALGKIFFYEPGAGSTVLKYAYSKPEFIEGNRLQNPVTVDLAGIPPAIFFDGDYRVVIKDSAGVTLDDIPNYQAPELDAQFQDWAPNLTYSANDFARGSNGKYYQSIGSNNTGNDPALSPSKWAEIYFIDVWNSSRTYALNDIVKYQDDMWVSTIASNTGNTPTAIDTSWRSFFQPSIVTDFTAAGFEYRHTDGYPDPTFLASTEITIDTFESIGPTGSGADNIWTSLDLLPSASKFATIRCSYEYIRASTTDDTLAAVFYSRTTGGAAGSGDTIIGSDKDYGGAANNDANTSGSFEFTIPVDSLNRFDFRYNAINNTGAGFGTVLRLVGYKV